MDNLKRIFPWWILLLSAISLGIFLLASNLYSHPGFPLDDSWIHQTYARNLAELGEFSFIPGQPSGGSTSPLWTAILAIGYALHIPYLHWTYFLGGLSLVGIGAAGILFSRQLADPDQIPSAWVGAFLVFEWHLVWAAGSGMETALYTGLILLFFSLLFEKQVRWFWAGFLVGVGIWLRPDGLTLLGPIFWVIYFTTNSWKRRGIASLRAMAGFMVAFFPYLVFNYLIAGNIWPNTFFAKQTEYALLQQTAWITRFWEQFRLPLVGAGALAAPGILVTIWHITRRKKWALFASLLWALGYMGLFAWRLPVTYQHGRYIIPVMPMIFIWGMVGLFLIVKPKTDRRALWVISRAWVVSLVIAQIIFFSLGARAYARDVAWIESEMVKTSKWITDNTHQDAFIAAHDIGALGYFSGRKTLDLAGLISPEVIPFLKDENQIANYLDQEGVDYLMTFPSWYPQLVLMGELVYQTENDYDYGMEPMMVFRWRP